MRRICAWCKKELKPREDMAAEKEITQGICSHCSLQFTSDITKATGQLLDLIHEPVLLIDSMGIIRSANESGLKLLGKDHDSVANHLGGDVFECAYAKQPEGCGKTEHCRTCAIRNVVMDTLMHDRSYHMIPAFQKILTPDGEKIMRFYISTEKVGEHILLRIDDVSERMVS